MRRSEEPVITEGTKISDKVMNIIFEEVDKRVKEVITHLTTESICLALEHTIKERDELKERLRMALLDIDRYEMINDSGIYNTLLDKHLS